MLINADFDKTAVVHFNEAAWVPSPTVGIDRIMLDRIGEEVARATSIVQYAPKSAFPSHTHGGGEEILVLAGNFKDEHGEYPAGSYFRNPRGTNHAPGSDDGCKLFVKLHQFPAADDHSVQKDTAATARELMSCNEAAEGVIYESQWEQVSMVWHPPFAPIMERHDVVAEYLILNGAALIENQHFARFDWIRTPARAELKASAAASGCLLWKKIGPK